MSINRHFEIIYRLLNRKIVTAKELAEHFEVSTRTIYRDVDALSSAGIPIYASKGKGGGISLLEGYSLNTSLITSKEQDDILIGLQTLMATDILNTGDILKKLTLLFKKQATNWIEVDFSAWGSGPEKKQMFSQLRKAILSRHTIRFIYFNSEGEKSERGVQPYRLLFKKNAWYLSGFCLLKNDSRIFKINRMQNVIVTDEVFDSKPFPQAAGHNAEQQVAQNNVTVTLRISSKGAYRVYDEFEDDMITENENGSFTIHAQFPMGSWLDNYLLSFGTLLEGIHPDHLRVRIVKKLEELKHTLDPV
ncbi:MAG: helix-turn-helix transcriptional regulator [Sporolactobacillus sp.]